MDGDIILPIHVRVLSKMAVLANIAIFNNACPGCSRQADEDLRDEIHAGY